MGQFAFVVSTVAAADFISFSQTVRSIPLSFVCIVNVLMRAYRCNILMK